MKYSDEEIDGVAIEMLRSVMRNVRYHTREIPKEITRLKFVKELLERANIDGTADFGEDDDDVILNTVEEYAAYLLGQATDTVNYHETSLKTDTDQLGLVTVFLARAGVDVGALEKQIRAKLAEDD